MNKSEIALITSFTLLLLPHKKIIYRDYNMFDKVKFLHDLDQEMN